MAKENKELNNVVISSSEGYGYSYASLADIAKQGYTIPLMKTGTENDKEYVYWKENDEWLRGAQIVMPSMKNSNDAQLYGAALTYARRYTTLMANCLATDDDTNIEKEVLFDEPIEKKKMLAKEFNDLFTNEEKARILNGLKITEPQQMNINDLEKYVNFKKYGN